MCGGYFFIKLSVVLVISLPKSRQNIFIVAKVRRENQMPLFILETCLQDAPKISNANLDKTL